MIRKIRGMVPAVVKMGNRVKQAACTNSTDRTAGLWSREPALPGATLGATRAPDLDHQRGGGVPQVVNAEPAADPRLLAWVTRKAAESLDGIVS
jgi:hypothetical protein